MAKAGKKSDERSSGKPGKREKGGEAPERKNLSEFNADEQRFRIVGIGASAGGLEALQSFIGSLPPDYGFALVFIQHLSTKYKSLLRELLSAKHPSIEIQEISDGLQVLAGRLYLAPPGQEVRLQSGIFRTTVHPEGLIHLPIDEFLASLAADAGERAVAVILSGAGTDGARGCRAIRAAGGTIYVQDPETAQFDAMPLAAIATGQADGVLSPGDIAREILKIEGIGDAGARSVETMTPEEYDAFFGLLLRQTGSRFNHYKKSVISRRIRRRMFLQGLTTIQDYLGFVGSSDAEIAALASDLMIGVTSFFRDRLAWKVLTNEVVRMLAAENADPPIRVWAPASATGEEAYSIAMLLRHELALSGKSRDIQVFATDVNDRALEKAREGRYPASISADAPREYIQNYLTLSEDGQTLTVNKDIRESVVFAKHDLLTDPPFSRLDLIICRNFLIYLEPAAQEKCVSLFHYALKDGGHLFLGSAETVGRRNALFTSIGRKQCRVYRKVAATTESRLSLSVPYASERTAMPMQPRVAPGGWPSTTGIVQEFLLEEFAPAAVAVDQNFEILYHNGPTNRYLRQPRGVPTQNLLDLLPETLRNRIRGAIYHAGQEEKSVVIRTNVSGDDNRKRPVSIRITKVREGLSVVVFRERKDTAAGKEEALPLDTRRIEENAIHQLESELSATRQDLQSNIEQLKGLNEELQSSNEELQAANEELETSREELQSLNEELVTVNSQLQTKIEEQDETNNDLNNFLSSTNIPTIFLDHGFKVKRFTPAMLQLIKLLPSDVGRPIVDLSQEHLGQDLIADAQAVLETLVPVKKEITITGAWYVRSTLPYRTADNRIAGVVVTYNDVTELKTAEERTRHLASFPQLNPSPVLEVAVSGAVIFSNSAAQAALERLGLNKEDATVFLPPDIEGILRDLEKKVEMSFIREVAIQDWTFEVTVHVVPQFSVVRLYAHDITERKRAEQEIVRAKEEWERTFASVPDMIAILDNNHTVVRVNEAMAKRIGRTPLECVGLKCHEVVHGTAMPPAFCPHLRTVRDGREHVEEVHEEHLGMHLLVTTTPLFDESGKMAGSVHVAHDITGRKRSEAELLKLTENLAARNRELEELNRELEAFNYSISHDLRAPLRVMGGFVKALEEDYADKLDAQGRDYAARISKASLKMTRLIDELLDLSRISRQKPNREPIDMSSLAASVVTVLREGDPERRVEVSIQERLTAMADPTLMELVLANLIGNAWKFTAKRGQAYIAFGACNIDGIEAFYVRDNGPGFDPCHRDKLFLPFQRFHSEKEFEGTGVGLAVVERIVRIHGGKVWADGDLDKGVVVYFTVG